MKSLIFLLVAVVAACSCATLENRIVMGKEAKLGEIPWQVSIDAKRTLGSDFCGGSLISDEWVITSAYCIRRANKYEVHLGGISTGLIEFGRVTVTSKELAHVHPNYDEATRNFDVALIHLPKKIAASDRIQPIRLPKVLEIVGNLQTVWTSGWGRTKPTGSNVSKLHYVDLSSITNAQCQNSFAKEEIVASTVCATGFMEATACEGDNGGPLYTTKDNISTLVGVFSFNHYTGCVSGKPSVFVRTQPLLAWIKEISGVVPPA